MSLLNTIGPWLCVSALIGLPLAFAWWLSDRFRNVTWSSGQWSMRTVFNPHTQRHGPAWVDRDNQQVVTYTE